MTNEFASVAKPFASTLQSRWSAAPVGAVIVSAPKSPYFPTVTWRDWT